MRSIFLSGYKAEKVGREIIQLGTWGSYGEQQLHVCYDDSWEGMDIWAVFVLPDKTNTKVLLNEERIVDVPKEATSVYLPMNKPGKIVFEGYGKGVKRLSTELNYICLDHAPTDGNPTEPGTPDQMEQYLEKVHQIIDEAVPTEGDIGQVLTKTSQGNMWKNPQSGLENIDIISGGIAPEAGDDVNGNGS